MKKTFIILSILALIATDTFAQRRVSGYVVGEWDEPLIGVMIDGFCSITDKYGVMRTVTTDMSGYFTLTTTKDTCELRVSYLGYNVEIIKITCDTVLTIILKEQVDRDPGPGYWALKQQRIGVEYDVVNSLYGVNFHRWNSYIIHNTTPWRKKDRTSYGISVLTNFKKDYGIEGYLALRSPITQVKRLNSLSLRYSHKNYSESDLNYHKIGIQGNTFLEFAGLFAEPSFQVLNNKYRAGLTVGASSSSFWKERLSADLSVGYFKDYWTYSIGLQGYFLDEERFGLRISYEKIARYDFLNVGLFYNILQDKGW